MPERAQSGESRLRIRVRVRITLTLTYPNPYPNPSPNPADHEQLKGGGVLATGGGQRQLRRVELLLGVGGHVPEGVDLLEAGNRLEVASEDDERGGVDRARGVPGERASGVRDEGVALDGVRLG